MSNRLIPVVLAAALTGCYKTNYTTGAKTSADPKDDIMHHRAIFGIVELPGPVNLAEVCPSGIAKVHTERDFIDGVLGYLTNFWVWIGGALIVTVAILFWFWRSTSANASARRMVKTSSALGIRSVAPARSLLILPSNASPMP